MEILKKCPFCKKNTFEIISKKNNSTKEKVAYMNCSGCGIEIKVSLINHGILYTIKSKTFSEIGEKEHEKVYKISREILDGSE